MRTQRATPVQEAVQICTPVIHGLVPIAGVRHIHPGRKRRRALGHVSGLMNGEVAREPGVSAEAARKYVVGSAAFMSDTVYAAYFVAAYFVPSAYGRAAKITAYYAFCCEAGCVLRIAYCAIRSRP